MADSLMRSMAVAMVKVLTLLAGKAAAVKAAHQKVDQGNRGRIEEIDDYLH
jgi:hypothetical protein